MDSEDWAAAFAFAAFAFAAFAFAAFAFAAAVEAVAAVAFAFAAVAAVAFAASAFENGEYKISIKISLASIVFSLISFAFTFGSAISFAFFTTWYALILFLIVLEIFFLLDKKQPSAMESKTSFALKRKVPAAFYSALTLFGGNFIIQIGRNYWAEILKWIGYIGAGLIAIALILAVIYLWGRLNALKYENQKRPVGRPKGSRRRR